MAMSVVIVLATLVGLTSDEPIPGWILPKGDSREFVYTTPTQFVVIRDGAPLAISRGVFRQDDPITWTNSGEFVAFLSNPPRGQYEYRELVFIDANSGAEQRIPCPGCSDITAFQRNSIVATRASPGWTQAFLRFDLKAPAPGLEIDLGDRADVTLETGSNFRLLVREREPQTEESGLVFVSPPTYARSWIKKESNGHALPTTAAPSSDRMAEYFLSVRSGGATTSNRGCDTHLWLSLISGDGSVRMTDASAAEPPGFRTDGHGEIWMDDAWWGSDGRLHATFTTWRCTEGTREVTERLANGQISRMPVLERAPYREPTLWTLDSKTLRWLPEPGAPSARMSRYIGRGQAIQLRSPSCLTDAHACQHGNLYHHDGTGDQLVATDVMTISAQPSALAPTSNSCLVEIPGVGIADIVVRQGDITCERAKHIYDEYEHGGLPKSGNAQHAGTAEWHCSSPTAGQHTSTGVVVTCTGPPANTYDWLFEVVDVSCGTDLWSSLIDAAITTLPTESITHVPWSRDPRTFEGNYDPCKTLSAVVITIDGATGSSPDQVLIFHKGVFIGTATSQAHGFTSLDTRNTTDDTVALTYKLPGSCNACPDATYFPVEIHWNGHALTMTGTPPN
ncbi:LppP/LprE family lipoprotein [Nocardia sp. NPDC004123]